MWVEIFTKHKVFFTVHRGASLFTPLSLSHFNLVDYINMMRNVVRVNVYLNI